MLSTESAAAAHPAAMSAVGRSAPSVGKLVQPASGGASIVHRAEHSVVGNGSAVVTRDDGEILVRENESVYMLLGWVHRRANPGKIPLALIEVQSGSYLGEDDIVHLDDVYGRA